MAVPPGHLFGQGFFLSIGQPEEISETERMGFIARIKRKVYFHVRALRLPGETDRLVNVFEIVSLVWFGCPLA